MVSKPETEGTSDPEYLLPERAKEVQRLTDQDIVIVSSMDNKRVLAPIDMSKPGLKILDSATADGLFLRAIEPLLTPPYTLSGFDVQTSFFPPSPPSHTSYAIHNLAEEWPTEMHGQYDLVHQRLGILGVGTTTTPQKAISYLGALVAPGGWIQLGEVDLRQPVSGGQALRDAWAVIRAVFKAVSTYNNIAESMAGWLREEGFEDVQEEKCEIVLGPRCKDPVVAQTSIDITLQTWVALLEAAKGLNVELEGSVTENLISRLETEVSQEGGSYYMLYAYGRKPL
ncbi:hypothetical protein F4818DRAFT_397116 [Hypoxylon cercidicola]|nr:hypothetical protein F4818DRAFT_397116 [Hypoxylon cercidicola]